jgi:hypothetical protein
MEEEDGYNRVPLKPAFTVQATYKPIGKMSPRQLPLDEGELWFWVRSVMSQGADIRCDYDQGVHKGYEAYSARLDAAAAERAEKLWARMKTPNVRVEPQTTAPPGSE